MREIYTLDFLKELREYRKLEEKELLLKLPCKVGDTVYRLVPKLYRTYTESIIKEIVIREDGIVFITDKGIAWNIDTIGKTIFLTKEEVEHRLKELNR